jgi:hypothetical protein
VNMNKLECKRNVYVNVTYECCSQKVNMKNLE